MEKIKVIHVIGKLDFGGAERLLLDICRKLDKARFEVIVVTLKAGGKLEDKFEAAGVRVVAIDKHFPGDFQVVNRLKKFFLVEQPQVVHTHLFIGDFWGGLAAFWARVPVIISTKHDILFEGWFRRYLGQLMRRRFTRVVAISEAIKTFLIKKEKITEQKIVLIYNGVDAARFYQEKIEILGSDKVIFGSVGRLVREKAQDFLIRALKYLSRRSWELLLVGSGPLEEKLKKQVLELKIEPQVTFVPSTTDVPHYLEKMDVFVLPSRSEGLSLAVIEAALAGKFIIASRVGGVPEIIRHEETGLLFNFGSLEELVHHLDWVYDHRDEARKMVVKLQLEVLEKFDINKNILQYQELYEHLSRLGG